MQLLLIAIIGKTFSNHIRYAHSKHILEPLISRYLSSGETPRRCEMEQYAARSCNFRLTASLEKASTAIGEPELQVLRLDYLLEMGSVDTGHTIHDNAARTL